MCAFADGPSAVQIDVASLPPGCYLVVLDDCNGRIRTQRLVIFR
ncbi:MAG: T9SS type A sorting domain-containing protein [Saprospirales bacterium]|nr:T9SS type A sorting domain-containing protein [Saprospirales bacterium]